MTGRNKLADHFGAESHLFRYQSGKGWYFIAARATGPASNNKTVSFAAQFLGRSLHDIQESAYWALKKLPGRDTF